MTTPLLTKDGKRLIKSRYLKVSVGGRKVDLHRYIMEQHLGRKLERWEEVHHKDEDTHNNRLENLEVKAKPDHFRHHMPNFNRTISEETREKLRRIRSGSRNNMAKLTWEQADAIRARHSNGEKAKVLAVEFGVHKSTVWNILNFSGFKPEYRPPSASPCPNQSEFLREGTSTKCL